MAELTRYVDEAGDTVLTVYNLTPPEPVECCMCGKPTLDNFAVPYYCGPTRTGNSEGGYQSACEPCYSRWSLWDDAMEEYDSWLVVLRETTHGVQGLPEVPVTLEQVEELARTMWKGEPVPGRVLRFGAAVLGLADAARGVPEVDRG